MEEQEEEEEEEGSAGGARQDMGEGVVGDAIGKRLKA